MRGIKSSKDTEINLIQRALREKWGVKKSTMQMVGPVITGIMKSANTPRTKLMAVKVLAMLEKNEHPNEVNVKSDHELKIIYGDQVPETVPAPIPDNQQQ